MNGREQFDAVWDKDFACCTIDEREWAWEGWKAAEQQTVELTKKVEHWQHQHRVMFDMWGTAADNLTVAEKLILELRALLRDARASIGLNRPATGDLMERIDEELK